MKKQPLKISWRSWCLYKLAKKDYSAFEMAELIKKRAAASGESIDPQPIVNQLIEEELISDKRYIENQIRIHTGTQNIKGPRELRRKLKSKGGIAEEVLDDYIDDNDGIWTRLAITETNKSLSAAGYSLSRPVSIPDKLYQKIRQRLYRKGFIKNQISEALQGIKPERETPKPVPAPDILKIIERQQNSGKGPIAVRHFLKQKGINESEFTDFLDEEDEGWIESARYVLEKKFSSSAPKSKAEKGKRIRYLLGRGFLMNQINQVLDS